MHNSKLKQITVALCMALLPISVFAAGLGKLNVTSGLGEPLRADIELLSVTPEELSSIVATVASEEAYANQGIERPASHNTIKVEVAKNASGAPVLKLKSSQPISEPFLDMLLQVDWSSGRLLREYTVLLDPPGYTGEVDSSNQASATQAPMVKSSDTVKEEKIAAAAVDDAKPVGSKKSNRRSKAPRNPAPEAAATEANGQDYTTQRGDTLNKIAREMKPEGVSLEQMLVGLYQANPKAFDAKNMNRLKVGQILKSPSQEALNAISRKEAIHEIKIHSSNWNSYRNKLADIVSKAKPSDDETAATQSTSGKIKSTAEDKSMPATGAKDVVKLSTGEATKGDSTDVKAMQAKISALQEEVTAREKSVKEAQDRTTALEKQVADMQKLLAMKNGAMADLQKQAVAQTEAEKNKPAAAKPEEIKPVEAKSEPATPEEAAKPAEEAKPVEAAKPAEAAKPEAAKKPATPEPVAEPSFLDGVLGEDGLLSGSNLPIVGGVGGLAALLGVGWMYLRKKREKNLADFEQGIMTSGGLKANTVFGNTSGASVDTGDTSFLTDFSQSSGGGMIDTNDVDPIAEAEVYMAYGRDAQAEEILKDAITKEPKRHELHLKLLEIYSANKNMSGFETVAGELYTTLGAEDPTWAKVAAIGIKLEPNNPLYQAGASPTGFVAEPEADTKPADNHHKAVASSDKLDVNDFSDSPLAGEQDLAGDSDADFSFDNDSLVQNFASADADSKGEFDLDFDAPSSGTTTASATPQAEFATSAAVAESAATSDAGLTFDMGEFSMPAMEEPAAQVVASFSNTEPELDSPTFEFPAFESAEPASGAGDMGVIESPSFDMSSLQEDTVSTNDNAFDFSVHSEDSDFNFDIEAMTPEAPSLNTAETLPEVSTFDLSNVSFDMEDSKPAVASGGEPIEVETKLALVSAYIEMDDNEGAKELLAEVMKEGGATQRQRAEALLAKLA